MLASKQPGVATPTCEVVDLENVDEEAVQLAAMEARLAMLEEKRSPSSNYS